MAKNYFARDHEKQQDCGRDQCGPDSNVFFDLLLITTGHRNEYRHRSNRVNNGKEKINVAISSSIEGHSRHVSVYSAPDTAF